MKQAAPVELTGTQKPRTVSSPGAFAAQLYLGSRIVRMRIFSQDSTVTVLRSLYSVIRYSLTRFRVRHLGHVDKTSEIGFSEVKKLSGNSPAERR